MSRVFDAMRRAAEEQNDRRAETVDMPPTVDFAEESFPAETPGHGAEMRRQISSPSNDSVRPTSSAVSVAVASEASADITPPLGDQHSETFDRVAVRYEGKTVMEAEVSPQSREQYRRLAASLHHAQALHGTKVVMITRALVGEGKTLTASNVALTLSQSYQKQVLLVDADLRRPSLQAVFGIRSGAGLTEGLTAMKERPVPVHQVSSRLGILQAG